MRKIRNFFAKLFNSLKDKTNIIIFIVVFLVLSCEVWVPIILGIVTQNAWWYGIAATCWAFWLAPFTPFLPLCIALTFAVRKAYDALKKRSRKRAEDNVNNYVENSKISKKEQSR